MVRAVSGLLRLLALLAMASAQTAHAQNWQRTDGAARDVGVGADGSVWVIGTNAVAGGYGIYRRTNNTWANIPGGAERIAVDPQGNAWVVNSSDKIFRYDGTKWVLLNGSARDIGVGANGTVWVIGAPAEAGGYGIYRSTDKGVNWTKIPGGAVRVSVDPQGNAWVVNSSNKIFRHDGTKWVLLTGAATDVGIGADGAAWVIGTNAVPGGYGIYRWEGSSWVKKPGGAAQIAAGPHGAVWVVNHSNQIYQATPLLSVSPVLMSFTARGVWGHVPPWRQTFEIRNAGGGTLTWTVTEGGWANIRANEQCQNPYPPNPEFYYCSGGIKGTPDSTGAITLSGSGPAIVAVRVPGWGMESGVTLTRTISISSNGGNATVSVTIVTATDFELDCSNGQDDDRDGVVDSSDTDCASNPWAG
ncbi:MAG: tectonin domain-containing protein [Steroidobacteraceae bacterium]